MVRHDLPAVLRRYYYVNGWPAPDAAALPTLTAPARWNTEGWVGALLLHDDIVALADAAGQGALVGASLEEAATAIRSALGRR